MTESIKVQLYTEHVGREKDTGRHFRILECIKKVIVWYMQYFMRTLRLCKMYSNSSANASWLCHTKSCDRKLSLHVFPSKGTTHR